jgi:Ca-activated chloride channel family protein
MKGIAIVAGVLILALVGAFGTRCAVENHQDPLVIVHWANSHPMRDGLLPQMAQAFNKAHHETSSGRRIEIKLVKCDSVLQRDDLVHRVEGSGPLEKGCDGPNPTLVTPQADDWLVDVNQWAKRTVVDLHTTKSIAKTFVGIVTYRDMAECLGYRERQIGYQDIVGLVSKPKGWADTQCAHPGDLPKAEWGERALLAFTNPKTSTTGRSVLASLYSIAAGVRVEKLTTADVDKPQVQKYVKDFQQLVAHYMPGTIPLNTKIAQGPEYGHFFLMPEDNLVSLHKGTERAIGPDGKETKVDPVTDLVMIYPKEGSAVNSNPAGLVRAPWVKSQASDAAATWISFLRADKQQRAFMNAGFRPGTSLALTAPISPDFGLDPTQPTKTIDPAALDPAVFEKIMNSWNVVKKPAIVTFVVDTSGSMEAGRKLDHAKAGLYSVLDNMAGTKNKVGLVTFDTTVRSSTPPAPLTVKMSSELGETIKNLRANGNTALYDAVKQAVILSDKADPAAKATRAIVVLSDGESNSGTASQNDIVSLRPGTTSGAEAEYQLAVPHDHAVQIFFIGFGDADINIGRIMAQATGAEYQSSTNEDLAAVIDEFGAYF